MQQVYIIINLAKMYKFTIFCIFDYSSWFVASISQNQMVILVRMNFMITCIYVNIHKKILIESCRNAKTHKSVKCILAEMQVIIKNIKLRN